MTGRSACKLLASRIAAIEVAARMRSPLPVVANMLSDGNLNTASATLSNDGSCSSNSDEKLEFQ
jgi:hypothetical protein